MTTLFNIYTSFNALSLPHIFLHFIELHPINLPLVKLTFIGLGDTNSLSISLPLVKLIFVNSSYVDIFLVDPTFFGPTFIDLNSINLGAKRFNNSLKVDRFSIQPLLDFPSPINSLASYLTSYILIKLYVVNYL